MTNEELLQAIAVQIGSLRNEMNCKFDVMDNKLAVMEKSVESLQESVESLQESVESLQESAESLQESVAGLEEDSEITRDGVNSLLEWADIVGKITNYPIAT